ncbi:uncharacterized protein DUF4124 [Panacagrimonas perspica]|uniref:Uncharacterized protein DUF4124 n=1 Tax=Panacagrimonas perspica TaxID=381431 RepID=A0A4S3JYJ2_9GAMM|nr:DUF4124 domain-containing protein [Panacagrimonas perspica]TDU28147.1 uncharacterized protein DUF4124 [Panacagrimonas perspica]THD00645.1 hypothetical protein B1810_23870 [Panacagrimonas perspica]
MRAVLLTLCSLLIADGASAAGERIYRWTTPDGKVQFGDQPPSGAQDIRNFDRRVGTTAAAEPAQDRPPQKTVSETDCINKRAQLNTYKNASRLVERDSLGREREYTVAEREQLVAKVQADLESQCGDAPAE